MPNIHTRIKEQRLKLDYTLAQIAEMLNVKEATVQRYESGNIKNLKHDTIVKLANILNCSPCYLMGWTDDISHTTPKSEPTILDKYNQLNPLGKEKTDEYVDDLLENPKYVAEPNTTDDNLHDDINDVSSLNEIYETEKLKSEGYVHIAADTGKNGMVKAPDINTIIELNKDGQ